MKVLVIDVAKLADKSCCGLPKEIQEWMRPAVLKRIEDCELKDVVEFEADIITNNEDLEKPLLVFSPGSKLESKFENEDEARVYIVKQKKKVEDE